MKDLKYPHKCLNILGNNLRIKIIKSLQKKPHTVRSLCLETKQEQSKVSHSLKQLRDCCFIDYQVKGKEREYFLKSNIFERKDKTLFELIEEHVKKYCEKNE